MTELLGKVAVRGRYFPHCGYVRLDAPYQGQEVVLLNEETKGRSELPFDDGKLIIGTFVVITEFKMQGEGIVALAVAVREATPYEKRQMVVSLRRGVCMKDLDPTGTLTLAQYLATIPDLNLQIVDDFPTGTTAAIRLAIRADDAQLQELRAAVGERCHVVERSTGRINI